MDSLVRRTKDMPGNWGPRAETLARDKVAPALERQLAELKVQRTRATMDAGMWARPRGDEYYQWALRASTTTRMSPDEVHQLGEQQVKELQAQMDEILKGLGYTKGTVGARMTGLADDKRFQFPDNDAGRAQILAFIQERLTTIRARLPEAFGTLAKGNVEVRRLPPEEEPGAPGAYGGAGSIDGSIPGKYWINLGTTKLHSRYSLPTLTHHEAIPGHVWQGEYSNQLPLIRALLAFNAYSEGWALYAEQLADELGVYEGDPVGRLGYLQSIAFRACRLVVDTGLHARRWTRRAGHPVVRHDQRLGHRGGDAAKWTAIAAGRARPAATRWGTARSIASASGPRPRWGRATTCAGSTTRSSRAATCRWTSWR